MSIVTRTCHGYLISARSDATSRRYLLRLLGDDGHEYVLTRRAAEPQKQLIRKLTKKIAASWPDAGWQFKADSTTRRVVDLA